ncbi:MAG: O-antigen translocase [Undibacterium sp.]|nr:O-antigen translocase [Undibacterium sp.]
MTLIRTSLLNAIAVGIRMLAMLGINKLLAVLVGPAGYALFGQFQNAITLATSFASGAINTGVTKYTAEYSQDVLQQHKLWRTAGIIAVVMGLTISSLIAFFHQQIALWVFGTSTYQHVFLWLAGSLILFVLNALLMAILNGKKAVKLYVTTNIATSIVTLIATWVLTHVWGLYGALVALCINQSIVFFVTLFLCWRCDWFHWTYLRGKFDPSMARKLGAYGLMALITAIVVPLSQMAIRTHLTQQFGAVQAGMWQAVTKMSEVYLMLITTTLTVYYLPRLAEIKDSISLRIEIIKVYRFILPLTIVGALLVYVLREHLVRLLFTTEFSQMNQLLAWQLLGDVVKIGSWILGFVMLGRAMTRAYILTEIFFSASLVFITFALSPHLGLQASVIAFFINYVLYWITTAVIVHRIKFSP